LLVVTFSVVHADHHYAGHNCGDAKQGMKEKHHEDINRKPWCIKERKEAIACHELAQL
jgi:hypothetical protein